jgi:DNA replication licensing factor MCM6
MEALEEANEIETEEQMIFQQKLIKSVLKRMIKKENILLEMKDLTRLDDTEELESGAEDPILVISPNYYLESEDQF